MDDFDRRIARGVETWRSQGWALVPSLVVGDDLDRGIDDLWKLFPPSEVFHGARLIADRGDFHARRDPDLFFGDVPGTGPAFRPDQLLGTREFPFPAVQPGRGARYAGLLPGDDAGPTVGPYGGGVAAIDRTAMTRSGLGNPVPGPDLPASLRADGWRDWFTPALGLRPRRVDVYLAVAIALIQVAGTILYSSDEARSPWGFDAFAFVLLVVGPVALLFRRRWPEATLSFAFAAAAAYAATGYPRGPAGFPAFVFALVGAIMMGRRALAWGVLAVACLAFTLLPLVNPDEVEAARSAAGNAVNLAWLPLVGAASEIARMRVERRAELARAEQEEARRRAGEQRMLIAREVHDVLAHTISLINVQSGVALHLLDEQPEQARSALAAINEASEVALGEVRSVLDVLHGGLGEDPTQAGAWAPRAPTTGLRDLDGLVRRTRAAGLEVRLSVEGETRPVPSGVDLAAFRIVQESLTNVVRHAGDEAQATVRLAYADTELVVQVDDDGRGAGPTMVGRGIVGMRERVQALGGTFAAGSRPGRGFRVRAGFPLRDGPR